MTEQEKNNPEEPQQEAPATETPEESGDDISVVSDDDMDSQEEEIVDPQVRIDELTAEVASEKEKFLRSLADMDNLRKRCRRDVEDARTSGRVNVLEELLPALDSIDMALKSVAPTEANQAVYDGMIMVRKQFIASMDRFALKPVAAKGEIFDPALHEAVSYIPSPDHEAGVVIDDMRTGYTLGERLLRASMVVVSSGPPMVVEESAETDEEPVEETTDAPTADSGETASNDSADATGEEAVESTEEEAGEVKDGE